MLLLRLLATILPQSPQAIDLGTMYISTGRWTPNKRQDEIADKYGAYSEDRLLAMCNFWYKPPGFGLQAARPAAEPFSVRFGFKRKLLTQDDNPGLVELLGYIRRGRASAVMALPKALLTHQNVMTRLEKATLTAGYQDVKYITDISALALHHVSSYTRQKEGVALWNGRKIVIASLGAGFWSVGHVTLEKPNIIRTHVMRSSPFGSLDVLMEVLQHMAQAWGVDLTLWNPLLWNLEAWRRLGPLLRTIEGYYKGLVEGKTFNLVANDNTKDELSLWLGDQDLDVTSVLVNGTAIKEFAMEHLYMPICRTVAMAIKKSSVPVTQVLWAGQPGFVSYWEKMLAEAAPDIECIGVSDERLGVVKGTAYYIWLQQQRPPTVTLMEES